jgi:hypothetical protein
LIVLVVIADVVDGVVAVGLEEEMPSLPRQHRQPADDARDRCVREQQRVAAEEDDGADQVQRLVDGALVVEAVIVEALRAQHVRETAHQNPRSR